MRRLLHRRGGEIELAVRDFRLRAGHTRVLGGLAAAGRELLVSLLTGMLLPDEGEIDIFGTSTRAVVDHETWLAFVDQFGVVSERAVLLDGASVGDNLGLPFALSPTPGAGLPDPSPEVRRLSELVELSETDLAATMAAAPPLTCAKVRLARALAFDPRILLLEDPTAPLAPDDSVRLATIVARIAPPRAVLALSEDRVFAERLGVSVERFDPQSGVLDGWWARVRRFFRSW